MLRKPKELYTRLSPQSFSPHLYRSLAVQSLVAHFGGAVQFVPGKALALNGAFQRLEQHQREQLPVGEALKPHLAEQSDIFAGFGLAPFQSERDSRGDEID